MFRPLFADPDQKFTASGYIKDAKTGEELIGVPVYIERNGYRMPASHRLDVSVTLHEKEKPNKKFYSSGNLSLYNVYARKNPYSIVPSVTYNFKFYFKPFVTVIKMKIRISPSLMALVAALFTSCEKVIDIDLKTNEPKPVIEGIVAGQPGMSYVKLSMSDSYFHVQNLARVSGALVEITDNDGIKTVFTETTGGYYQPCAAFAGAVDKSYNLKGTLHGKTYFA